MTEPIRKSTRQRRTHRLLTPNQLAFALMSVFSLLLILRNAELAISSMSEGLRLCARTLIPSLFPFMVISELIVSTGAVRPLGKLLSRPFRWLFGISGESGCAVLLGLLCGFPVGTKSALSLFRRGRIDRAELEYLLTFSNNPSSAFLISTVGSSLFGDHAFGVRLYVISLCSALLIGIFGNLLRKRSGSSLAPSAVPDQSLSSPRGILCFTEAVTSSALSMLYICAFMVFFSAFTGTLEHLLSGWELPDAVRALCFGFFELTGGVSRAAQCAAPVSEYLCALAVGWSGLSVHFQMMSLCGSDTVSFRSYFPAKLVHGLLNMLLLWLSRLVAGWLL